MLKYILGKLGKKKNCIPWGFKTQTWRIYFKNGVKTTGLLIIFNELVQANVKKNICTSEDNRSKVTTCIVQIYNNIQLHKYV